MPIVPKSGDSVVKTLFGRGNTTSVPLPSPSVLLQVLSITPLLSMIFLELTSPMVSLKSFEKPSKMISGPLFGPAVGSILNIFCVVNLELFFGHSSINFAGVVGLEGDI